MGFNCALRHYSLVSTEALQRAASVVHRAAFELKHHSLRDMSQQLGVAVLEISDQRESLMERNSKACMVSFAEQVWQESPCMQQGCGANIVPFCHEHSRSCAVPGCAGWGGAGSGPPT